MKNRRLLYIWLVIILTILTVGVVSSMRIDNTNTEIYDKLDTNIRYGRASLILVA
ncbi:hypothetical protein DW1_0271 [Proteiniborus sp. DW1]|uniref:hypothetical protein n=1 Tax=Proteiniborus sp. DW1 TaxID=1889883 RepID=UPI00092E1ABB|nr:hypothetical protein [Proteiniborus sp. DW1]SCG81892.1 hypothetical protein DW1_0271 [Proteiniborus sp. DW1]